MGKIKPRGSILYESENIIERLDEDRYVVTEVYKTGEKALKRGPKPQGYNVYQNGTFQQFLPYGEKNQNKWLIKKGKRV